MRTSIPLCGDDADDTDLAAIPVLLCFQKSPELTGCTTKQVHWAVKPAMRSKREERCHLLVAGFPHHSLYTEMCWMHPRQIHVEGQTRTGLSAYVDALTPRQRQQRPGPNESSR